jgi:hypothetical protein
MYIGNPLRDGHSVDLYEKRVAIVGDPRRRRPQSGRLDDNEVRRRLGGRGQALIWNREQANWGSTGLTQCPDGGC